MAIRDRLADVPVLGTVVRLQTRYKDDDADQYAAAIAFFAFLSLFPLLLLALAVAARTIADDPAAQAELARTIRDVIPGFGALLGGDTEVGGAIEAVVRNSAGLGLVSVALLVPSALKVVRSAMQATNHVFHVEVDSGGVKQAGRMVGALVVLGALALLGVAASSAAGAGVTLDVSSATGVVTSAVGTVLTLVFDFVLFLVAYRILAGGEGPAFATLWPGALLGAVGWGTLKIFGGTYVSTQITKVNELYGALGGVIALLLLLYLAGRLFLYGAELSALLLAPGADMARRDDDVELADTPAGAVGADGGVAAEPGDDDGPAPADAPAARPRPRADEPAPVSPDTGRRMADLDGRRGRRQQEEGPDVRGALGLLLGLGALGALARWLKPWEDDDGT